MTGSTLPGRALTSFDAPDFDAPDFDAPDALVQEPFTGSALSDPADWYVPAVSSGTNSACITASSGTSGLLPGCGGTTDSSGNGALRLTAATTDQEGGVAETVPILSSDGLDVTFDSYQYGTSNAGDGTLFFLAAVNPADPVPPTTLGQPGGFLAYGGDPTFGPGLSDAYLGVGLDAFGNYTSSGSDGSGCTPDPSWAGDIANQVTVRGPGGGTAGYCLLSSSYTGGSTFLNGWLSSTSTSRSASQVPMEVAVNPTATGYTTSSGLAVPAYSYAVAVTPEGAATQVISGVLPHDSFLPASWTNASTGVPLQLVFGFAGSTGASYDVHEITNVQAVALTASSPELSLALADSEGGSLDTTGQVTYTATASVSADWQEENDAPTIIDNFPTQISDITEEASSASSWDCDPLPWSSPQGTSEACTYSELLPVDPGAQLEPLRFDATVTGSTGAVVDDSASITSDDAGVAVATDYARIGRPASPNLSVTASAPTFSASSTYTLTLNASTLGNGGPASGTITLKAVLPSGESFKSPLSASGWSCNVTGASSILTCTTSAGFGAGSSLPVVQATVSATAVGLYTAQVALSDPSDLAFGTSTFSSTDYPPPVLGLNVLGTPTEVSAGSSYTPTFTASTSSSGGEAFNSIVLAVSLPSGESFTSTPAATGWTCSVTSVNNTDDTLSCNYAISASGPLAAGSTLAPVSPTVKTASSAKGTLGANAFLSDTTDGAATLTRPLPVQVTTTTALSLATSGTPTAASAGTSYTLTLTATAGTLGGNIYNEPVLAISLQSGETFASPAPAAAGWSCTPPSGSGTQLTCTSTIAMPEPAGTVLGSASFVIDISASADTPLETSASLSDPSDAATMALATATVDVTPSPGMELSTSGTPVQVSANTSYDLTLTPALSSAGPAYHDPQLSVALPSGETFSSPLTTTWWSCTSPSGTSLTCTSTRSGTIAAGAQLGPVEVQVDIAAGARNELTTAASLSDVNDAASATTANASVVVTPSPVLLLSVSGTPPGATGDNSYVLELYPALGSAGGQAYDQPMMSVTLPTGETFSSPMTTTGWSCTVPLGSSITCTHNQSTPIPAGTSLGSVTVKVNVAASASGTLTTAATLSDAADGATANTQQADLTATPTPVLALSTSGTPLTASADTTYALTLTVSVPGASPGPAYSDPTISVVLPSGESFAPTASPSGWACAFTGSQKDLTCTATGYPPFGPGSQLTDLAMTVDIAPGARGELTTTATVSDPGDGATTVAAAATVTVTATPVLALSTSGTPASATTSSSYTLTLAASLSGLGGAAYHDPSLSVALPAGETFEAAPAPHGWSCSLAAESSTLNCTSTATATIGAGTSLGTVAATVEIAAGYSGTTLTTTATLSDGSDGATPVTQTPAVGVTGFSFPEPAPTPWSPPPATTTTSSSTTTTSSSSTTTTPSSSTTGPSSTTTTMPTTTVTGSSSLGPGPLKDPVFPPALKVVVSAPKTATAGGSFTLRVTVSLKGDGGPAYHDPAFSVDLPAHTTFPKKAPKATNWSCTVAASRATLVCRWTGKLPVAAGKSLGTVKAVVDIASDASGSVPTGASLSDTADAAGSVGASITVTIAPAHGSTGPTPPGPSSPGTKNVRYGYRLVARDGGVFSFGAAQFDGSCQQKQAPCGKPKTVRIAGAVTVPAANGYWLVATNGAVFAFGRASSFGSCTLRKKVCGSLRAAITSMAVTPDGRGYWLAGANGAVFAFGDARQLGSCTTAKKPCGKLRTSIVGIAATPDGKGYWLAGANGTVFAFGDASRFGSCTTSARPCTKLLGHITGIAATSTGKGYWLVSSTGRVLAFGNAKFLGDTYTTKVQKQFHYPIIGITAMKNGTGYWLTGSDGRVFATKGAKFMGDAYTVKSLKKLSGQVVGIVATQSG
jgi:hypothetical protein